MHTLQVDNYVRHRAITLLIGMAVGLATAGVSHAMSGLMDVSIEPDWPATSSPGTVIVYKVATALRAGQGSLQVSLGCQGMPKGAVVSFSPSLLHFTGGVPEVQTSTMTVTCPTVMPVDDYSFIVTATAPKEAVSQTNRVQQSLCALPAGYPVLALDRLTNGTLKLRGKGSTGETYQIESTLSVTQPIWKPTGSCTADGNGRFTFIPGQATNSSMRLYRAVLSTSGGSDSTKN